MALTSAPWWSRRRTTPTCPFAAASCNGRLLRRTKPSVSPSAFGSQFPRISSRRKAVASPAAARRTNAVFLVFVAHQAATNTSDTRRGGCARAAARASASSVRNAPSAPCGRRHNTTRLRAEGPAGEVVCGAVRGGGCGPAGVGHVRPTAAGASLNLQRRAATQHQHGGVTRGTLHFGWPPRPQLPPAWRAAHTNEMPAGPTPGTTGRQRGMPKKTQVAARLPSDGSTRSPDPTTARRSTPTARIASAPGGGAAISPSRSQRPMVRSQWRWAERSSASGLAATLPPPWSSCTATSATVAAGSHRPRSASSCWRSSNRFAAVLVDREGKSPMPPPASAVCGSTSSAKQECSGQAPKASAGIVQVYVTCWY